MDNDADHKTDLDDVSEVICILRQMVLEGNLLE